MSFLDDITVLILTFNEQDNIARTLDALEAFSDIVALDSGSDDSTRAILARYANVRVAVRPFDSHATQWNHGLSLCGGRRWILALDADYRVTPELVDEMSRLSDAGEIVGYRIGFRYIAFGRALRRSLYPPIVALFRHDRARFMQEGHTQRAVVDGCVADLTGRIDHDDRKPLSRWFAAQARYARLEADHLLSLPRAALRPVQRVRRLGWAAAPLVFGYIYFARGLILDGWRGLFYAMQRALVELMIGVEILDRKLSGKDRAP